MSVREVLAVISGLLMIAAYFPYIRAMVRRETKPIKATWFIWAFLNSVIFAGMYSGNAANHQITAAAFGTWIIAFFTLKYGIPGWTRLDKFCLAAAAIAITLWRVCSDPLLGVMISLAAAAIGSIPTFVSAWKEPGRENKTAWTINFFSCACMIAAVSEWTLAKAIQPSVYFALSTVIAVILYRPHSPAKQK